MANQQGIVSAKLDDDDYAAFCARVEAEGLKPGEALRALVHQWLHDELPTTDDGYHSARRLAAAIARRALEQALRDVPEDFDAAMQLLNE